MKNRAKAGLTLVELLCTIVIMLLVSVGMVEGVNLAVKNYKKSLLSSESQVLCSTLTNLVSDELRYSGAVYWDQSPIAFFSRTYGDKCAFDQNADGQVTLGDEKLLPSKAYHLGMKASVTLEKKQDDRDDLFTVTIVVTDSSGAELAKNEFDVEKLNVGSKIGV